MAPNNPLSVWGNDKTMNLNSLVLTNIQSSPYFKVQLFELKTFHEVVDEIYYRVEHLEPWEKGSRKTAGQTGMCGGVRGVGAGGIVSSAYCLLYKMFTLKLTRKQVNNLISHSDSPYIRGLGFMYIRYTQQPGDLWDWYEPYLNDEEELDVKAGGGHVMAIGEMLRQWLVKLEWYSTLFPRIPVPIQKDIAVKLRSGAGYQSYGNRVVQQEPEHIPDDQVSYGEAERAALSQRWDSRDGRQSRDGRDGGQSRDNRDGRGGAHSRDNRDSGQSRDSRDGGQSRDSRDGGQSRDSRDGIHSRDGRDGFHSRDSRDDRGGATSRDGRGGVQSRGSSLRHSPLRRRSPSFRQSPHRSLPGSDEFSRELEREKERQRRERNPGHKRSKHDKKSKRRTRSRSTDKRRSWSRDRKRSLSAERQRSRSHSKERALSDERRRSVSNEKKMSQSYSKDTKASMSQYKDKRMSRSWSRDRKRARSKSPDFKRMRSESSERTGRQSRERYGATRTGPSSRDRQGSSSPETTGSGFRDRPRSDSTEEWSPAASHYIKAYKKAEKKKHKSKKKHKERDRE